MIKYNIHNNGVIEFINNEMSVAVEDIVETLLKQDYIMELFEGDMEAAEEEIFMVAGDTKETYEYIDGYFRTLHKRIRTNNI
ncbi:hypothetical protein [Metabacillus litoralis]|uniref:Uncharacterized protein n=1 Tax=Metabacillus litoralis TaxID=152268 RepID=A0A179SY46_9BACI|nr:hypothetical protein [Metabacillus litoralis]OAS85213.1 hypothetical protein A6K24_06820 [Metabacillus litoralis]